MINAAEAYKISAKNEADNHAKTAEELLDGHSWIEMKISEAMQLGRFNTTINTTVSHSSTSGYITLRDLKELAEILKTFGYGVEVMPPSKKTQEDFDFSSAKLKISWEKTK